VAACGVLNPPDEIKEQEKDVFGFSRRFKNYYLFPQVV
jgi:hypothetical protein